MIRLSKPEPGPPILSDPSKRGPKETQLLKDAFDAFDAGTTDFDFKSSIYGAKSVKNRLIKLQSGKCCFCEADLRHVSHGDVEHFRPKGGFQQDGDDDLHKPGYYWLAYDWRNLFLSCQICNQRHKKNLFPLTDSTTRATSHHDDIADEEPVFIHPADEDPEDFIGFREEFAFALEDNEWGKGTIEGVGLNRDDLVENRRDHLKPLALLARIMEMVGPEEQAEIRVLLDEAVQSSSQYSAMVKAALA